MFSAFLLVFSTVVQALSPGDLQVSVTVTQPVMDSVDHIVISSVVANPTGKDIRVFAKNNVLDESSTPSFSVTKDGTHVMFTGVRVSDRQHNTLDFCSYLYVGYTNTEKEMSHQ